MLRYVLFDTTCFANRDDVEQTRKDLMWMLEALCQRDQDYLRQRPETPKMYRSGIKYMVPAQMNGECEEVATLRKSLGSMARDPKVRDVLEKMQNVFGGECFRDIGRIIENGGGDCDNLACWRVAELRQAGIAARPYMTHRERWDGGTTYHALVIWPPFGPYNYETTEDPSLLLGMSQPQRATDRAEEIRKNQERFDILKQQGGFSDDQLEGILGLRRSAAAVTQKPDVDLMVQEVERLLKAKGEV